MPTLSGGDFVTFKKPYLELVAERIRGRESIKFGDGESQVVKQTQTVKKFLSAVSQQNQSGVNSALRSGSSYLPIFNEYKWTEIDKDQFFSRQTIPTSQATAYQERASLYAIQKSIENNGYTDQSNFFKAYRKNLKKIYPDMNEVWENTFFQQQLKIYKEVGNTKYRHYSRDDGFMKFITDLCRDLYGISNKDTWNPADIWLVSNYGEVKRQLVNAVKDDKTSIQEFNSILREMFLDRKIVGISLKKISRKEAAWELVNVQDQDLYDNDEYLFNFKSCELNLKMASSNQFVNADTKIIVRSKKQDVKIEIRQNAPGFNNLKIEGTDLSASSARLGKVPLDMASELLQAFGLESKRWRKFKNYPTTKEEFVAELNVHENRFKKAKESGKVNFGQSLTVQKFSENMLQIFDTNPKIANTKLNQLDLISQIVSLNANDLNDLLTNMTYFAQKKGDVFGPFAKVY